MDWTRRYPSPRPIRRRLVTRTLKRSGRRIRSLAFELRRCSRNYRPTTFIADQVFPVLSP